MTDVIVVRFHVVTGIAQLCATLDGERKRNGRILFAVTPENGEKGWRRRGETGSNGGVVGQGCRGAGGDDRVGTTMHDERRDVPFVDAGSHVGLSREGRNTSAYGLSIS